MPWSHEKHGCEGGKTRRCVNDDTTGKVADAPLGQQTVSPDHVDEREIHEEEPDDQKDEIGLESHAVGECTGDQRRRDDGKHHLVYDEREHRDLTVAKRRREVDPVEEGHPQIPDDRPRPSGEAQ